ncbi:hypothetical protein BKA57DRAFT_446989 [Linnemannia elongata]|nr:hypothetical protein BKA57DRAFT_475867 [Linnemannia elongata]KAH7060351.1 hypothetical protein BKA57DRAFT_446989 [Linnemannia elongata]
MLFLHLSGTSQTLSSILFNPLRHHVDNSLPPFLLPPVPFLLNPRSFLLLLLFAYAWDGTCTPLSTTLPSFPLLLHVILLLFLSPLIFIIRLV